MGKFYPLYVRRSDGKLDMPTKGRREPNAPTKEQLDQTPDKNGVSDFYREIPFDETKHLDWRRKLGGMLARELDSQNKSATGHGFILAAFPEHYRLYEHVKRTEKDGKTEVKSKTHAAGGNDRQDAYLYGHPAGKRKRFRSPGDFFPHLLWLCTDESGDPNNCTCKLCSPEDLENAIPGAKAKSEKVDQIDNVVEVEKESNAPSGATKARYEHPRVVVPLKPPPGTPPVSQATVQSSVQPSVQPPVQTSVRPPPPPASNDEELDRMYNGFMFRPGELVWFQRGTAWGLGAVLRRWSTPQARNQYLVQPLSYPGHEQPAQHRTSNEAMRPWLAWSVPKYTNDGLNRMTFTYNDADWAGIHAKRYGMGDTEVDASILAAKSIDSTYTLLDPYEQVQIKPGVTETYFRAAFVGAEKIWPGEPIRLNAGTNTDVMIVHQIIEQSRQAPPSKAVHFIGDVYRLLSRPHDGTDPATLIGTQDNPNLPRRMNEDMKFRNSRSIPMKRIVNNWSIIAPQARIEIDQIKGRWYEASMLLPMLLGAQFEGMVNSGEISEASAWMNARGDCVNSNRASELPRLPRHSIQTERRREALGRAVPATATIFDGLDPPPETNILAPRS